VFKSIRLTVLSLIALAVVSPRILAQVQPSDGVTSLNENPLQIAILHWCKTNRVTQFKVGDAPIRVAFDGGNLWVVNNGSNNVTQIADQRWHQPWNVPCGSRSSRCSLRWCPHLGTE